MTEKILNHLHLPTSPSKVSLSDLILLVALLEHMAQGKGEGKVLPKENANKAWARVLRQNGRFVAGHALRFCIGAIIAGIFVPA